MPNFPIALLGDLAKSERAAIAIGPFGSRMKADTYVPVGVPVIRGTNISRDRSLKGDWVYVPEDFAATIPSCALQGGDLVFPHRGSIGEVALIETSQAPMILSSSMMKFRPDPLRLDGRFAYYFFKSKAGREEILRFGSQVGTPGIGQPLASLKQFRVPLPSLDQQIEIAKTLAALDDKIELNRRMNVTLEAMTRAIFKDWFVDFGPTCAKIEGRAAYLAPELWSLFPTRLDDEGKPEGWLTGTLADYASLNSESWTRSGYPVAIEYVDLSGTKWGTIESVEVHSRDTAPSRAQRILRPGDTVVGTVRPGNGSYALISRDGLTGSTGFAVLRPHRQELREITYLAATDVENIDRLSHLADGGAYPAVRPEIVSSSNIVISHAEIVDAFSEVTRPLIDRCEANKNENRTLSQTRDLLLPKLMSGKIRVREAEELVAAAQ